MRRIPIISTTKYKADADKNSHLKISLGILVLLSFLTGVIISIGSSITKSLIKNKLKLTSKSVVSKAMNNKKNKVNDPTYAEITCKT